MTKSRRESGHASEVTRRHFMGTAAMASGALAVGAATPGTTDAETESEGGTHVVELTVNGHQVRVPVDSRTSLLDMLRERLHLMGTKKGCNAGACGACTVLVNGRRVDSCLTLAVMHEGARITSIEGLADGDRLHPLQQAFIDRDAMQCGYCTPGQIMSGVGCIAEKHTGSPAEIREWMSGNICRCGAYSNIVAAISDTARRS
jgi:xanthine dehydrogenase YagT iron-sulfur-binding subunit